MYKIFFLFLLLVSSNCRVFSEPDQAKPIDKTKEVEIKQLNATLELAKGNQDFKNLFFKEHEQDFLKLVKDGQSPKTLFIGCSDSRVIPELISQSKPGQLFVIRTAGNFVPLYDPNIKWDGVAATIEYAVQELNVQDIIVCGHSNCGAIKGLFSKEISYDPKYRLLSKWLIFGQDAKKITNRVLSGHAPDKERFEIAERISVLAQLDHLLTYPFIKEKVDDKKLYLHGWHFSIETGDITYFDPVAFRFIPISNLIKANASSNGQVNQIPNQVQN